MHIRLSGNWLIVVQVQLVIDFGQSFQSYTLQLVVVHVL